jgi:hypothetical protein
MFDSLPRSGSLNTACSSLELERSSNDHGRSIIFFEKQTEPFGKIDQHLSEVFTRSMLRRTKNNMWTYDFIWREILFFALLFNRNEHARGSLGSVLLTISILLRILVFFGFYFA